MILKFQRVFSARHWCLKPGLTADSRTADKNALGFMPQMTVVTMAPVSSSAEVAASGQGLPDVARNVIGCHLTQYSRV